jgi:hypothetical protein
MRPDQRRSLIGLAIMCGSMAALFLWGHHFHLFGHAVRLGVQSVGLFGWLAASAFGAGYTREGAKGGLKWLASVLVVMVAAMAFGVATGRYR